MAKKLAVDKGLFSAVVVLVGFGLVMVYSTSDQSPSTAAPVVNMSPLIKQLFVGLVGFLVMLGMTQIDYRLLRRPWVVYGIMAGVLALLVAVLSSPSLNNSHRWLFFGGFSFQPSELAKIGLVVYLAYQIDRKRDLINTRVVLIPCGVAVFILSILILVQPDFGMTALLAAVAVSMFFLGGLAWRYVFYAGVALLPALALAIFMRPDKVQRLLTFLDPSAADPQKEGYQIKMALTAVGSGGVSGVGLGESVQKLANLPMAESDFIYAVVCEELGLIGGVGLLLVFAFFTWRGFVAGRDAPDTFGRYLAWGLTAALSIQALLHMSISVGLAPTTGMTLPFVSYGGSSLIVSLLCCGLLLNVSQHA
jgi:cell division protein FtsW